MADFLVTIDGKYLYNGIARYFDIPEYFSNILDESLEYLGLEKNFDHTRYDIIFNDKTGRVQVFGNYMALYDTKTGRFKGYLEIDKFWETAVINSSGRYVSTENTKDLTLFRKFDGTAISTIPLFDRVKPKQGDRIIFCKKSIVDEQGTYKIETTVRYFIYSDNALIKNGLDYEVNSQKIDQSLHIISNNNFFSSLNALPAEIYKENLSTVANYHLGIVYKNIVNNGFKGPNSSDVSSLNSVEIDIVESITLLFQHLFNIEKFVTKLDQFNLTFIFGKFFEIFNQKIEFNGDVISQDEYYESFTEQFFDLLYLRLHEFYLWAKGDIFTSKIEMLTWIVGLFDENIIKHLPYNQKLELLKFILTGAFNISGRWNMFKSDMKCTNEEVIIKIIKSIKNKDSTGNLNFGDIDDFMNKLCNTPFYNPSTSNLTLYEVLYDKIDPDVIFGGAGAQGQLVDAVYDLWLSSKYNPKVSIPNIPNYLYQYTANTTIIYDAGQNTVTIDENAAPMIMPYLSTKDWLWYNDNFKFVFKNGKIVAAQEKDAQGTVHNAIGNLIDILLLEDFIGYRAYGTYHIFQPINIVNIDPTETFIKVPFDRSLLQNSTDIDPCDIEASGRGSNLPIFYLKHIDDIGDRKDIEESVMLAVDIISIVTGGWGLARRLIAEGAFIAIRNASVRAVQIGVTAAISEITPAVRSSIIKALKSVIKSNTFNTLELVFGAASVGHIIVTGNCEQYNDCNNTPPAEGSANYEAYKRCQAIQKWLFALEILTLSADAIARKFFKKATRELRENLPATNPYSNVTSSKYNEFRSAINGMDEIAADLDNFLDDLIPSMRNKVEAFPSEKKYAFMFDFEGKTDDILKLSENQSIAVDRWSHLHDIRSVDKNKIEILTDQNLFDGFVKFCSKSEINKSLSSLTYAQRLKLIKKYSNTPFSFSSAVMDKINASPSRLNILVSHMDNPRIKQSNMFDDFDIKSIIESDLLDIHVDILDIKISMSLKAANSKYLKKIQDISMNFDEFSNIYKGNIGQFSSLSDTVKKKLKNGNKYITETKIYNNGTLVSTINTNFVSGDIKLVNKAFGGSGNIPSWITNPNQSLLNIFSIKAFDLSHPVKILRNNDTEIKYIFDFLTNHWNSGNKFVINVKSTLYTCTSCQGYLGYLQLLAEKHGKNITFKIISNPEAKSMADAKKLLQ